LAKRQTAKTRPHHHDPRPAGNFRWVWGWRAQLGSLSKKGGHANGGRGQKHPSPVNVLGGRLGCFLKDGFCLQLSMHKSQVRL
jgi:hypothetical protein